MQLRQRFLVLMLFVFSIQSIGQPAVELDTFVPPRLVISVMADPFFLTYEYAAPDIGLELRLANQFSLYSSIGTYRSTGWFKHHIQAKGIHTNTQLRYYTENTGFFGLSYGYQELTRPMFGTFPSASGYYLKESQLNQYWHNLAINAGMRSTSGNFLELEMFVGYGVGIRNNHFTGLTAFENTLVRYDHIPEFKRIGGANRSVISSINWSIRVACIILK